MPHHHICNWQGALHRLLLPRINRQETGSLAPSLEDRHCSHLPSGRPCMEWPLGHAGIWSIYLICLTSPTSLWYLTAWVYFPLKTRDFFSAQVEDMEHPLRISLVPVVPAWWWFSELSVKSWYEGVGSPRWESAIFLMRSSPAFSSSLADVAGGYFREKKYTIIAMSTGGRTAVWEVQRSPCPGGYLALSLEHLRDDEIVLTGICLGKEIHLIRISWWRAWFKKTSLLSAAIRPLLKSHLFQ